MQITFQDTEKDHKDSPAYNAGCTCIAIHYLITTVNNTVTVKITSNFLVKKQQY